MVMQMTTWLLAIPLLGMATGMRTMTGMAVLCWFAWLGYLPVKSTWAFWTASLASVIVFTLLAFGEYIGDKLPKTPNRTSAGPLIARFVFGGLAGAIAGVGLNASSLEAGLLALVGVAIGAFGGMHLRGELSNHIGCKDWHVALTEDAAAILFAVVAMGIITG